MPPATVQPGWRFASIPSRLGTLEGHARALLNAQDPVQGLPKKGFRKFRAELNLPGHFVRGQVTPAM